MTVDERGIAEVAMVRADKMNAIDAAMFKGLIDAIDQLRGDKRVRVVVVHGEGRGVLRGARHGPVSRDGLWARAAARWATSSRARTVWPTALNRWRGAGANCRCR